MRSAMSSRPSSVRSSLTFPAAFSVRLDHRFLRCVSERADTRDCNRRTGMSGALGSIGGERRGSGPRHRGAGRRASVGRPSPACRPRPRSRPTRAGLIHHAREPLGMAERRRASHREPGRGSRLFGGRPAGVPGAHDLRELRLVHPVRSAGERHDRTAIGHEDERLHDLADIAADRARRRPSRSWFLRGTAARRARCPRRAPPPGTDRSPRSPPPLSPRCRHELVGIASRAPPRVAPATGAHRRSRARVRTAPPGTPR